MTDYNQAALIDSLKKHEGCVLHAYEDHLGYQTIGIGRLIDKRKGGGITVEEAEYLLSNDISNVVLQVTMAMPWVKTLSDARQRVLYEMAFQLGLAGLMGFNNTLQAVKDGSWQAAAKGMLDSKWARQTPTRAKALAEQMLKG